MSTNPMRSTTSDMTALQKDIASVLTEAKKIRLPQSLEKAAVQTARKIVQSTSLEDRRNFVSESFDAADQKGEHTECFDAYCERVNQLVAEAVRFPKNKIAIRVKLGNVVNSLVNITEGMKLVIHHRGSGKKELVLVEGVDGTRGIWAKSLTLKNRLLTEDSSDAQYISLREIRNGGHKTFYEAFLSKVTND